MSEAREQLKRIAGEAGYPPGLLCQIAHATLPTYTHGDHLVEEQISQVSDAAATLWEAGLHAEQVRALIQAHEARHGEHWREGLWKQVLARAGAREARGQRLAA